MAPVLVLATDADAAKAEGMEEVVGVALDRSWGILSGQPRQLRGDLRKPTGVGILRKNQRRSQDPLHALESAHRL